MLDFVDDENTKYNVDVLKSLYTNIVKKKIAGFDRITSINVTNGRLILNKTMYVALKLASKEDLQKLLYGLPSDLYEYVNQGMTAYFFDWSLLLRCRNLRNLIFDDFEFVSDIVSDFAEIE